MASTIGGLQSKAVVHAATKKAEGLLEPLLAADDGSVSSDEESSHYTNSTDASEISIEIKQTPMQKLKTALVGLGFGAGVVASAGAMIVQPAAAVFVMGGLLMANVPYAAFKEFKIVRLPALRTLNSRLRAEADHLEQQVDVLEKEIGDLEPEAARAKSVEEELNDITAEQHYNVDKFVALVKENERIVHEMKTNLRQRIVQDVLSIVVKSDKNNDGRFSKVETKLLVLKIGLALQEYDVEFDEAKFVKVMGKDPSVTQTIKIVKRLVPDLNEARDDEKGEEEEEAEIYDMFHMAPMGSVTRSAASGDSAKSSPSQKRARVSLSMSMDQEPQKKESLMPKKRESLMSRQGGIRKEKSERRRDRITGRQASGRSHGGSSADADRTRAQEQLPESRRDKVKHLFRPPPY